MSTNSGVTWSLYKSFNVHNGYFGSKDASNFYQGILYYGVILDSGWQNGIKIYPVYTASNSQALNAVTVDLLAFNLSQLNNAIPAVLLSLG